MNDPLVFQAWRIRDTAAEDAVLCGMIRWPNVVVPSVRDMGLTAADFSQYKAAALFDAAAWVAAETELYACLADIYAEVKRRGLRADMGGPDCVIWLADIWFCSYWPNDIGQWWLEEYDPLPHRAAVALAMGRKVMHLAARREAVHRAAEAARDAIDGVHDTDTYEDE